MKSNGIVVFAIICFILLVLIAPFWVFPRAEQKLDEEVMELESFKQLKDSTLKWNGRDGYLTVPRNLPVPDAEKVANDIAEIQGVRDVEIIYDDAITVQKKQCEFEILWVNNEKTASGIVAENRADELNKQFGVDGLLPDYNVAMSDQLNNTLEKIDDSIFTDLNEGSLVVTEEQVMLTGVVSDPETIEEVKAKWGNIEGLVLGIEERKVMDEATEQTQEKTIESDIADIVIKNKIQFELGSDILTSESKNVLSEIAEILNNNSNVSVEIIGHTDAQGDDESNLRLSKKRAEAVKNELILLGIDSDKLIAEGKGEAQPIDSNETAEGRRQNRRVEFHVKENK